MIAIFIVLRDYTFIAHVWAAEPRVYWHDVIASRIQRCSEGKPE